MKVHEEHSELPPASPVFQMTVPGARASALRISSVVNSMPRWLLKTNSKLSSFLLSILQCPRRPDRAPTSQLLQNVWPMPIPFPEAFRASGVPDPDQLWRKRLVSLEVVVLSWLSLGSPTYAPPCLGLGAKLTAKQWSAVSTLQFLSWDGNTPEFIDSESMGRGASKVESYEDAIEALHRAVLTSDIPHSRYFGGSVTKPESDYASRKLDSGQIVGLVQKTVVSPAKDIEADRLEFPAAPSFDPTPLLDEVTAEVYRHPIETGSPGKDYELGAPVVHIRATKENKMLLLKKLRASGRLEPLNKADVRRGALSGLFAAPKSLTRDRLILDARPANMADVALNKWCKTMASAAALCDICLEDDQVLAASGEDLRDFFYQFKVGRERTVRNALADPLTREEAIEVFGHEAIPAHWEPPIYCGLSTLAMGDQNACEFAQCSHLALMLRTGVLSEEEMLSLQGDVPRGLLSVGVIIDDLVLLEKLLMAAWQRSEGRSTTQADLRLDKAVAAYKEHGLEVNLKKEFRNQTLSRFWGIELDGQKGLVRGSSLRLWPLTVITARVAMLGLSTVALLEAIAGSWISIFSTRRRFLRTMNLIFEATGIPQQNMVLRLSPALLAELWTLVCLGPLATTNLRARFQPFITSTDASSGWLAAVRAQAPLAIVSEVARRGLRKGRWSKLLPSHQAWLRSHGILDPGDELPGDTYDARPIWVLLARCLFYEERWRKPVARDTHINILELRAHLLEERRLSQCFSHSRFLYGIDSQVSLGALVKGRAASKALNRELIKALPHVVSSDLYSSYMYYPSKVNRADGPTRDALPADPDVPLPDWWNEAASGNFAGFDAWLRSVEGDVDKPDYDCRDLFRTAMPVSCPSRVLFSRLRRDKLADQWSLGVHDHPSSLTSEAVEILKSIPKKQFLFGSNFNGFCEPGYIDLFSGGFGVARAVVKNGAPWCLSFEWKRSAAENLLLDEIRAKIRSLIRLRAVRAWGAAPICASFSVAVTPPVRSARWPRGLPNLSENMRRRVREGNSHADFVAELITITEESDPDIIFWFENPDTSWLWRQKKFEPFRPADSDRCFRCCFCRFGTPWKKPTRFGTSSPSLRGLRMMCRCGSRKHVQLRGRSPYGKSWTQVAEPYPRHLCDLLGKAVCGDAGWGKQLKLDVAGCSRSLSLRPGEAVQPGPRRKGEPRSQGLDSIQLLSTATLRLESEALVAFLAWARAFIRSVDVERLFASVPECLIAALLAYGNKQYLDGASLSRFRHLILCCQRWVPSSRTLTSPCWDLVAKWETVEPVCHRVPVPEGLVRAMVVMAWQLKWFGWAGITLIAFYGAGRVGEVLKCCREDLLFPSDILDRDHEGLFLRLRQFKSLGRQPARTQHMEIRDPAAVALLSKIFEGFPKHVRLYQGTPSLYRRRWDAVLNMCEIPADLRLTPGGLRGGAAVMLYRKHTPIQDILWRLRLRSQSTLESYLQETAASSVFASLHDQVRVRLFAMGPLFELLAS